MAGRTDNESMYSLGHFYKQCECMFDLHELRSDKKSNSKVKIRSAVI